MIDDMEMDQFDYDAAVRGFDSIAPTLATTSLDKNPDDGVRALQISKATGIPAPAVMDDLDGYDSQIRSELTSRIVSDNDVIAEYLRENPLADVVSNDDYGNMDNFARTVPGRDFFDKVISGLEKTPAGRFLVVPAGAGIAGAAKGAFEAFTAEKPDYAKLADEPVAVRAAYGGADLGLRFIEALGGAVAGGAMGVAGKFAEELGTDEAGIERAKRDALAFVEDTMGRASFIRPDQIAEANIARRAVEGQAFQDQAIAQTDALNRARPWVESGMEPPVRAAPEIDALKAEVNFNAVEAIYENHDAALQMLTKERSPELAAAYIKKFYGENSIGIPAERIAELYGDRVPEAGDGILGWVPDLAQQLEDGVTTGGDVKIPLADWIANVDPQVANGLKPDMRVWPGGITATEAAGKVEPKAVVDSPIAQARAAFGTEPLVGFGDRKFTVRAVEEGQQVVRFGEVDFNKPQGLYFSLALKDSAHAEEGIPTYGKLKPKNKLVIEPFKLRHDRGKGFRIPGSAGIGALKQLFSEKEYTTFLGMDKTQAGEYLKQMLPDVDVSKYYDSYEILEAIGAEKARLSGFDAIELRDSAAPEFDEIVALNPTIFELSSAEETKSQKLQFLNETGEPAGELTIVPEGNQLRIEDISGDLGMYADTIGPSSFVDIAKQLKEMFPEAEELVVGEDVVPLTPEGYRTFQESATKYATQSMYEASKAQEWSEAFAQDTGGRVVWEEGDVALIEGFSTLNGQVLYAAAKKGFGRTRVDIESYTGSGFTPEELERLKQARAELVEADRIAHEQNPNGPFAEGEKFSASPNIPEEYANYTKEFLELLGIDSRIHLTTPEDAKVGEHYGPYSAIRSAALDPNERGSTRRLANGDHYISVKLTGRRSANIEVLAHEVGHIFEKEVLNKMDVEVRNHIIREFNQWIGTVKDATGKELVQSLRAHTMGKQTKVPEGIKATQMDRYWSSFSEWFADNVAKWATTQDKPLTLVDKFFARIGQAMRKFYATLKGKKYLPAKTVKVLLDERTKLKLQPSEVPELARDMGVGDFEVSQPKDEVEPPPKEVDLETALTTAKEQFDTLRASKAGLSKKTFDNLQKLTLARHEADLKAHLARVERMQRKAQTKEWKAAEAEVRKAVADKISQRPDVLADALVGSGELGGKKLKQVYPLREDALTPEQKAGLPRHYYSKDGLVPDMVAGMFGYPTGDMMVNDIIKYNVDRGDMSAKEHLKSVIDAETQRAMEWMHGKLDENIMRDAIDQATSEMDVNLVLEEWQGFAMENGIETISKEALKAEAQEAFGRKKAGDVSLVEMQRQMITHLEKAKDFLAAQDYESAVRSLEQRSRVKVMLAEAKKFDKTKTAFERTAKQFSKRNVPSAEQEYTNWIHHILMRVGRKVKRSAEDLKKEIDATQITSLEDFVAEKASMFREVAVWDELFDSSWSKDIDTLSVDNYRAVADSIKSLVFHAKDERKIYRQGEAADFDVIKAKAIEGIEKSANGKITKGTKGVGRKLKTYYVAHLQTENILNRWDAFNPNGTWNQYIMRDLIDGANQIDAWKKEYAKKFKELSVPDNIRNTIDNPLFVDQDTNLPIKFTRKNLIAVMLNTGTGIGKRSNLYKLAEGYKLDPQVVMDWVNTHATAEDWKLVREIWDIFEDIKTKSDTMYRSLSGGVPAESLPIYPIDTPHGVMRGGYYPIFWHSEMEGKSKKLMGKSALEGEGYYRATTPAGYTKSRTGYAAPMALDFDALPGRISQMLQDVGLRPAIINASKLFYDHDVRSAIRKHYGEEYKDMLHGYLKGVANSGNNWSLAQREMSQVSEFIRQNLITTLVGLNPGTVLKHFPSAAMTSIREVGPQKFLEAVQSLHRINESTGESNWQFAVRNSLELQRRDRNWEETLFGASTGALSPGDLATPWRQRIIEWSSKPVALSDMISAVPTWLAEYGKQMDAGETHGDAVYMADRAVRRAHGSTAPTTRTQMMREQSGWLTSVYNFFSDIMNRQMETIWRAGEVPGKVKEGDMKAAVTVGGAFTASLFAYAIWPAIVEHMVSGQAEDEHESWGKAAAKAGLRTAASSWVGVRDFTNWMLYGNDPQFGMAGTAMKEIGQFWSDMKKDHPLRKDHMGRLLQDGAGFIGTMTGMMPQQIGKSARYIHDVNSGIEHPKGPWAWAVGLRFGTTKGHSESWEDFVKGKVRK